MITSTSIAQQAIRILTYVDSSVEPASLTAHDNTLTALYNMHRLFPAYAIITCPVQHGSFFYISDNCQNIFGYTAGYMAAHLRDLRDYVAQIHEADLGDFRECLNFLESFVHDHPNVEYYNIRTTLHYRFRHASGRYVYLCDEKASLLLENGSVVHYSLIRAMPAETVFPGVKIEVFKQEETLKKISEYKPAAATKKLSGRESELVTLIKKGLTTKEIAWQLSISHNTVRNIKSKLFQKYSVNNTIELLNAAG